MKPTTTLLRQSQDFDSLDYHGFRDRLRRHLLAGDRLLTLFGSPLPDAPQNAPILHAVVLHAMQLIHFSGHARSNAEFPSLTPEFPSLHCFEREIHEQYGLAFPNHPWLKPIRFEDRNLGRMDDYPFYRLAGKEVHEVGVGPIHAGVIEPGHFRFMCLGETVHHLEIHLGYQHRGVESLLLQGAPRSMPPLIESIAGDSAVAYALCFCRAWEALCGATVSPEIELIRGIALELERIAMHLVGLAGLATDVAFMPGSSTYGRLRTSIINLTMRLCGSRFGRSWFRPAELRFGMSIKERDDIRKTLHAVQRDLLSMNGLFRNSKSVRHRLVSTGIVKPKLAQQLGMVGMAARASGRPVDLRQELRAHSYSWFPIPLVTDPHGDCHARGLVRIGEMDESIRWILGVLEQLPDVLPQRRTSLFPQADTFVVSVEEGWRGEVMIALQTDETGRLVHAKVQDPSLRNWFGLAHAVRENAIYDFPICNKSFDLSYCGNDL